jgi:hypothetical protein
LRVSSDTSAGSGTFSRTCRRPGAKLEEIREHGYVLSPGRTIGAPDEKDDGDPFDVKMKRLTAELGKQRAEAAGLGEAIAQKPEELGWSPEEGCCRRRGVRSLA